MQYSIQVAKPCHESWDDMTQAQGGRHCAQCAKTVQDFTGWQPEDILQYVQDSSTEICGRFRTAQLNVPVNADTFIRSVAHSSMPLYKKIAAIFLLSFGLLQMSNSADAQVKSHPSTTIDTLQTHQTHIMGGAMPYKEPQVSTPQQKPPANNMPKPEESYLQGDVAVKPHVVQHTHKTQKQTHTVGKISVKPHATNTKP